MKKTLISILFLLLGCYAAQSQELSYSLPRTSFLIEVKARQIHTVPGPYAAYASKMLGIDVPQQESTATQIRQISIIPCTEADPSARFRTEASALEVLSFSSQGLVSFGDNGHSDGVNWRFEPMPGVDFARKEAASQKDIRTQSTVEMMPTDSGYVIRSITRSIEVRKTEEDLAAESAERIIKVRQEKLNISIGNTDASFSGAALPAALSQLSKIEQDELSLFTGQSVSREISAVFEIIPPASSELKQRCLAFRCDDVEGLLADGSKGTPYYLELEVVDIPQSPQPLPEKKNPGKKQVPVQIHYREPAICNLRIVSGDAECLRMRVPVYQLGRESVFSK